MHRRRCCSSHSVQQRIYKSRSSVSEGRQGSAILKPCCELNHSVNTIFMPLTSAGQTLASCSEKTHSESLYRNSQNCVQMAVLDQHQSVIQSAQEALPTSRICQSFLHPFTESNVDIFFLIELLSMLLKCSSTYVIDP